MKRILRVVTILFSALMLSSVCSFAPQAKAQSGLLGSLLSGSSSGQTTGAAVKSLYEDYKKVGKIDLNNPNTILNVTKLATGIQGLKGQSDKSKFYKDFAKGLVLGSNSLISTATSSAATSTLAGLANNLDFGALLGKDTPKEEKTQSQQEVISGVSKLFSLFK